MFRGWGKKKNEVDERIVRFIRRHHAMTLATSVAGAPYCCNIFYTYIPSENLFVFTSAKETKHAADMLENSFVAASIMLETRTVGKLRGLQLQGNATLVEENLGSRERKAYLRSFPYAAVMPLELWTLRPTTMKLTDNRLGFGKKITWHAQER